MNWYNSFKWKTFLKQLISSIYKVKMAYSFLLWYAYDSPRLSDTPWGKLHAHIISCNSCFLNHIPIRFNKYNKRLLWYCVQILSRIIWKLMPPEWIDIFQANEKMNFQTMVFDHVLCRNFSNILNDFVFLWYFNHI